MDIGPNSEIGYMHFASNSLYLLHRTGIHTINSGIRFLTKTCVLLGGNEFHAPSQNYWSECKQTITIVKFPSLAIRSTTFPTGQTKCRLSVRERKNCCKLWSLICLLLSSNGTSNKSFGSHFQEGFVKQFI